jgi:prepilin-type processing-associated H-X9-DG protein
MAFVQLIEFETSRIDEVRAIGDQWEAAAGADRKAVRRILCEDRYHPGRYCNIVFFDSYEEAMENSNLPVTQEFSAKMMALGDGQPTFHNLNVVDDRS